MRKEKQKKRRVILTIASFPLSLIWQTNKERMREREREIERERVRKNYLSIYPLSSLEVVSN